MDKLTLLAVLLMAAATYATRGGGLWLASRFRLSERAGKFLEHIPAAILVSLVAPNVVTGGPAAWVSAGFVAVVAWRTGSLIGAMVAGVGVVFLLRSAGLS